MTTRPQSVRLERAKIWLLPATLGALVSAFTVAGGLYAFAGKLFVTNEAKAADEKARVVVDAKHEEGGHPVLREKVRVLEEGMAELKKETRATSRNLIRLMIRMGARPIDEGGE